jgi:hypothetical protein
MFDWDRLADDLSRVPRVELREVNYHLINETEDFPGRPADWPFLKRRPYSGENEVRALYSSPYEGESTKRITLSEGTLKEIVLSPNLPASLKGTVIDAIQKVSIWRIPKIHHSTLLSNSRWMNAIRQGEGGVI